MKLQTKKIIAREFIVLIASFVIALLAFLGTVVYNAYLSREIASLSKISEETARQADSLAAPYRKKLDNQQWFSSSLGMEIKFSLAKHKSYDVIWKTFQEMAEQDSIIYRYNSSWAAKTKEHLIEIGFNSAEKLNNYIHNNIITASDVNNYNKSLKLYPENSPINSQIGYYQSLHYTNERQMEFSLYAFVIAFSLLFVLRYIYYGVKWSIRTLKE